MSSRLLCVLFSLLAASAWGRSIQVSWARDEGSLERRQLIERADVQLKEELQRRGVTVLVRSGRDGVLLEPHLEVSATGLALRLITVRASDRALLGVVTLRGTGPNREAILRALVRRACDEALLDVPR